MQAKISIIFFGFCFLLPKISPAFQEHYERGNFRECVRQLSDVENHRSLHETEIFFLGECYFQLGNFTKAHHYFAQLLRKNSAEERRVVSRLVDIYQNTGDFSHTERALQWLEKNSGDEYQLSRLRNLLLQNGHLEGFLRLYRLQPYQLDTNTWTRLFRLEEKLVTETIKISPVSSLEKDILLVRYLHHRGESQKAEKMIRAHPQRNTREFRLALFEILVAANRKEEAIQELSSLLTEEPAATLTVAELFFEKGYTNEAIATLQQAEEKGLFFPERKIFFLNAAGKKREALLELEQGRYAGKIGEYQYLQIRTEMLRSWSSAEYLSTLAEIADRLPGACRTLVELGATSVNVFNDERLLAHLRDCNDLLQTPRRSMTLQILYENKRYPVIIQILQGDGATDLSEKFLLLKTYYHAQQYARAAEIGRTLQQDALWNHRAELRYYCAKVAMALSDYSTAASLLENLNYENAAILYLEALLAARNWEKLADTANKLRSPWTKEAKYYLAVWSLNQGQKQQAAILLEDYLGDPGIYGVRAVHLLFVLKYFAHEDLNTALAANLALYPDYLKDEDWSRFNLQKEVTPASEFEAYSLYWQARFLLSQAKKPEAIAILNQLKDTPVAAFLQEEISFLIESSRNNNIEFIRRFPASPFRVLGNP